MTCYLDDAEHIAERVMLTPNDPWGFLIACEFWDARMYDEFGNMFCRLVRTPGGDWLVVDMDGGDPNWTFEAARVDPWTWEVAGGDGVVYADIDDGWNTEGWQP